MVTCGRQPFNMLPMAPINPFVVGLTPSVAAAAAAASLAATTTSTPPTSATASTKPKLAFSIDSIVGESQDDRRPGRTCIISPPLSSSQRSESPDERDRGPPYERSPSRLSLNEDTHSHCQQPLELRSSLAVSCRPADGPHLTAQQTPRGFIFCRRRSSLDRPPSRDCGSSPGRCRSRSPLQRHHQPLGHGGGESRSPTPSRNTSQSPQLQLPSTNSKGPLIVPGLPTGLIRPLAIQPPPNLALVPTGPSLNEPGKPAIHSLPPHLHPHLPQPQSGPHPPSGSHPGSSSGLPPTIPPGGVVAPPPQPPPPNPHFLAAQFQMAAALAHHHQQQQQQHHPPPHLPPGHPMGIFPPGPHHPHFGGPHLIRDSYPLYPWLLSRHGRIFPHRFPGNFLLQPFRKPKRVRTAFSPTQLLKLEHAFEGNHYVVGAERKQLAQGLSLTETQVKVWFQNRRTKHKRMQQEGDSDSKSNKGSNAGDHDGKNDSSQNSFEDQDLEDEDDIEDEDEVIDMDDYGSEMDAEEHQRIREQFQQQLQQHQQQMQQHMQQSREQQGQPQHGQPQLSQQQQQQMLQQHHHHQQQHQQQQQFVQHQLYLQQQQQQQQQKQP